MVVYDRATFEGDNSYDDDDDDKVSAATRRRLIVQSLAQTLCYGYDSIVRIDIYAFVTAIDNRTRRSSLSLCTVLVYRARQKGTLEIDQDMSDKNRSICSLSASNDFIHGKIVSLLLFTLQMCKTCFKDVFRCLIHEKVDKRQCLVRC